jgi:probable aminopeptidase NPEPL1
MSWYPASFELCNVNTKKPLVVFGPDLKQKLDALKSPEHPCLKSVEKESFEKTFDGTRYCSIGTSKFNRNTPKSGITGMKSIMGFVRSSQKSMDINDEVVDRDLIHVVCNKVDLVPIAKTIAMSFPLYCAKTADTTHRSFKVRFTSVDDNDKCEKAGLINLMDNVRQAAKIADMPCNFMHCTRFLEEADQVVKSLNNDKISFKVIRGDELRDQGFGGLFSVGQASVEPPALCIMSFIANDDPKTKNICLVGKGIVYDTGGLSIKSKTGMPGMKHDCGGAAGLLYGWKNIVQQEPNVNVHVLLCLAENSVASNATRPDDVITMYSGKTVEINNTDAEGRLVLGDGVHYACKDLHADIVLNMCTLTGAQGVTTGHVHSSVMTNREEYEAKLVRAGLDSGDPCYPIIYAPELLMHEFDSQVADMKNSVQGRTNAQASCAGNFIGANLVNGFDFEGTWIHVDMASPSHNNKMLGSSERATGYGVALLSTLFEEYCDKKSVY